MLLHNVAMLRNPFAIDFFKNVAAWSRSSIAFNAPWRFSEACRLYCYGFYGSDIMLRYVALHHIRVPGMGYGHVDYMGH